MNTRNTFLDYARGLGIVLVVFGHAQRGLHDSGLLPQSYPFDQIDFTLYTFHMPLFFLLAGLYVWPSLNKGTGMFLRSKLSTIVAPYFFWSIIQGGIQIAMSGSTNHPLHVSDWRLMFYAPIAQFWFLYALLIWQLIAAACNRYRHALVVIAVAAFALGSMFAESFFPLAMKMGVFFVAGTMLGPQIEKRIARFTHPAILVSCCFAFLLVIYPIEGMTSSSYCWATLPAAALGILITLALCSILNRRKIGSFLVVCGEQSMPIYAMHIIAVSGVRIALRKVGIHNAYVMLTVCTVAGVVLPLCVAPAIDRLAKWMPRTRPVAST
jgi:fucose 4-O-acetylase-like acetyltransferase